MIATLVPVTGLVAGGFRVLGSKITQIDRRVEDGHEELASDADPSPPLIGRCSL